MNIIFQRFVHDEREVISLGAIGISIIAGVGVFFYRVFEKRFRFLDLRADFWKVGEAERRAELFYKLHEGNLIKQELVIFDLEAILRKVEGLLDEVNVSVVHRRRIDGFW